MNVENTLEYYAERLEEASNLDAIQMMYELAEERLEQARTSIEVSGEQLLRAIEDEDYWFRLVASARLSEKIIELNFIRARIDYISDEDSKQ